MILYNIKPLRKSKGLFVKISFVHNQGTHHFDKRNLANLTNCIRDFLNNPNTSLGYYLQNSAMFFFKPISNDMKGKRGEQ